MAAKKVTKKVVKKAAKKAKKQAKKKPARKPAKKAMAKVGRQGAKVAALKKSSVKSTPQTQTPVLTTLAAFDQFTLETNLVDVVITLAADEITVHNGEGFLDVKDSSGNWGPASPSTIPGNKISTSPPDKWQFRDDTVNLSPGDYRFRVVVDKRFEQEKSLP